MKGVNPSDCEKIYRMSRLGLYLPEGKEKGPNPDAQTVQSGFQMIFGWPTARWNNQPHRLCRLKKRKWVCTTDSNHELPVFSNMTKELSVNGPNQQWVAESLNRGMGYFLILTFNQSTIWRFNRTMGRLWRPLALAECSAEDFHLWWHHRNQNRRS